MSQAVGQPGMLQRLQCCQPPLVVHREQLVDQVLGPAESGPVILVWWEGVQRWGGKEQARVGMWIVGVGLVARRSG